MATAAPLTPPPPYSAYCIAYARAVIEAPPETSWARPSVECAAAGALGTLHGLGRRDMITKAELETELKRLLG